MRIPRTKLGTWPTPLHEVKRLRAALGGPERCPRILFKRDDLSGLAFGGNKTRKLEFLIADAVRNQATVVITSGGPQSNHARMTAAAARSNGLGIALVLTTVVEPPLQGNLLLDSLLGAEIHFVHSTSSVLDSNVDAEKIAEVADDLRRRSERSYIVPLGGSNALGTLGYVAATAELVQQLADMPAVPTRLYYASGSRGTQAGPVLGAALHAAPYQAYGVAVSSGEPAKTDHAVHIAQEAAELLGRTVNVDRAEYVTDSGYIGKNYRIPSAGALEAIDLVARNEGILLDPVYTGKATAALIDHVRQGVLRADETVVFLHTGGAPALFAHADVFSRDYTRTQ